MKNNFMEYKNYKFQVGELSPNIKFFIFEDIASSFDKTADSDFIRTIKYCIDKVLTIPIDYEKQPIFTFFILPDGEIHQNLSGSPFPSGISGIHHSLDKNYPMGLAVSEKYLNLDYPATIGINDKTGLIHELAHIIHGAYFLEMGVICEGFAELIPHYILDLQNENPKHLQRITDLKEEDISTLDYLNTNGMFTNPEDKKVICQYRKSYISMYLWMYGYIKEVENKYKLDKFGALNKILTEFKRIDTLSLIEEKKKHVATLIEYDIEELHQTTKLQLKAQNLLTS